MAAAITADLESIIKDGEHITFSYYTFCALLEPIDDTKLTRCLHKPDWSSNL